MKTKKQGDDGFRRAVKRTCVPKSYIKFIKELDRESAFSGRRWEVLSIDPTGGATSRVRILTEDGDLVPAPVVV